MYFEIALESCFFNNKNKNKSREGKRNNKKWKVGYKCNIS